MGTVSFLNLFSKPITYNNNEVIDNSAPPPPQMIIRGKQAHKPIILIHKIQLKLETAQQIKLALIHIHLHRLRIQIQAKLIM